MLAIFKGQKSTVMSTQHSIGDMLNYATISTASMYSGSSVTQSNTALACSLCMEETV